jgi:hypothetical protein
MLVIRPELLIGAPWVIARSTGQVDEGCSSGTSNPVWCVSTFDMFTRRMQFGLAGMLLVGATACSAGGELPPEPPPMSVINQSNGVHTEVEADSWCVDGLFGETCAAVDRSLTEVLSTCDDQFVVAPPDGFTPQPVNTLTKLPEEMGRVWFVEIPEGTIAVRAEASGQWDSASWTFELIRPDGGC